MHECNLCDLTTKYRQSEDIMSKSLTIGSTTFLYPVQGTAAGWGEESTDWAEAVTDLLGTLSGPNDISLTSATILDNQSTAVDIGVGASILKFSTSLVRSFVVDFNVLRGSTVMAGTMTGAWNGSSWEFSFENTGDAGMDFEINSAGQVQYFSDAILGGGTIQYSAKTKAQ